MLGIKHTYIINADSIKIVLFNNAVVFGDLNIIERFKQTAKYIKHILKQFK